MGQNQETPTKKGKGNRKGINQRCRLRNNPNPPKTVEALKNFKANGGKKR